MNSIFIFGMTYSAIFTIVIIQIIVMALGYAVATNLGTRRLQNGDISAVILLGTMITAVISMVVLIISSETETDPLISIGSIILFFILSGGVIWFCRYILTIMKYHKE